MQSEAVNQWLDAAHVRSLAEGLLVPNPHQRGFASEKIFGASFEGYAEQAEKKEAVSSLARQSLSDAQNRAVSSGILRAREGSATSNPANPPQANPPQASPAQANPPQASPAQASPAQATAPAAPVATAPAAAAVAVAPAPPQPSLSTPEPAERAPQSAPQSAPPEKRASEQAPAASQSPAAPAPAVEQASLAKEETLKSGEDLHRATQSTQSTQPKEDSPRSDSGSSVPLEKQKRATVTVRPSRSGGETEATSTLPQFAQIQAPAQAPAQAQAQAPLQAEPPAQLKAQSGAASAPKTSIESPFKISSQAAASSRVAGDSSPMQDSSPPVREAFRPLPLSTRLHAFGIWLKEQIPTRSYFICDRHGQIVVDEVGSDKLVKVARTLAHASSSAGRQVGEEQNLGSLHVKIGVDKVMEVVPRQSHFGLVVLGIIVQRPLSRDAVASVSRALGTALAEPSAPRK